MLRAGSADFSIDAESGERADFDRAASLWPDPAQVAQCREDPVTILRLKKLLPHRRDQVGAAGEHANIACVLREEGQPLRQRRVAAAIGILEGSIRTSRGCWMLAVRWVQRMPLRPFALEAERPAVLAKTSRDAVGSTPSVRFNALFFLIARKRRQHALRREWRLMQAHAHRIINRIRDRWNRRGQRSLAAFLRSKRALRDRCFPQ